MSIHKFKLVKTFLVSEMCNDVKAEIIMRSIITPLDISINTTVIVKYIVKESSVLDKWLLEHGAQILEEVYLEYKI